MKTAVGSFTTRALGGVVEQVDAVGEAGYDGIELAVPVEDEAAVSEALDTHGMDLVALPVDVDAGDAAVASVAETARALDSEFVAVYWKPPDGFASLEAIEETAAELDALAEAFAERGIDLLYHHHSHEFVDRGGGTAFSRLVEQTATLGFVIDTGWARLGGADPAVLIQRHGDRVGTIHVTDVADGPVSHDTDTERGVRLGEGIVDLPACLDAAREHGIEWATFEGWEPDDTRAWIEHARGVIDELLEE
jgi:sugar phosphate isomerase/epimerase